MSAAVAATVSRCLVELARLEEPDQLAALATIMRTWLAHDHGERAPVWAAACRAAGKAG